MLAFNTKNKTTRNSRESSRSVLTFSNPNYNIDGTPMEPKTNIWKRFKYDKPHVRLNFNLLLLCSCLMILDIVCFLTAEAPVNSSLL